MATFGAKYPRFAKTKSEPAKSLPTYDVPVTLGHLVKADLSVTLASGELYADDVLLESVSEWTAAKIAMETDDMTDDVASIVYGATVTDKQVSYKAGDSSPLGGLAYYKVLMRDKKKLYKGFYYPSVKAELGNDTAQTKGNSITFGTSITSFTVYACATDEWRITHEFDTEEEVKTWCDKMLGVTPPAPAPASNTSK